MIDLDQIQFTRPPKVAELALDLVKLAVLTGFTLPAALAAAGRRARRRLLAWALEDASYAARTPRASSEGKREVW